MPDITAPAAFTYSGGMLRTARMVPARFRYTAGNVTSARDTAVGGSLGDLTLDRLTMADRIPGESEAGFMRRVAIWQSNCEATEDAFAAINARVDELAAILARLTAAEALAQTANDNAATAQATATAVQVATQQTFTDIDPVLGDTFETRLEP